MRKIVLSFFVAVVLSLMVAFFMACAQNPSTTATSSFVKDMAESIAQQSKNTADSTETSEGFKEQSIQSLDVKAMTGLGTPDASGWYSESPADAPAGVVVYFRFVYSTGITTDETGARYWLTMEEIFAPGSTYEPDYIESRNTVPGRQSGETVNFYMRENWAASNYGTVTPSVYVINQSTTTYEVTAQSPISLESSAQLTGVGTCEGPNGTMSISITGYSRLGEGPIYTVETLSGVMTDPYLGAQHTISGTNYQYMVSGKRWMYGTITDADLGLIGVINVNLTDSTGTALDMMTTPWTVHTISLQSE